MLFIKKNVKLISLCIASFVMFIFWLFPYLSNKLIISSKVAFPMECVVILIIGILACLSLIFLKDLYYLYFIIAFVPFVFARPFDAFTVPWSLFVAIGLCIVGIIVRIIRFGFKFKIKPFFYGIVALAFACLIGGIGNFKVFKEQFLLMLVFCACLILLFVYFSSENNCEFKDFALILVSLGIFLSLQVLVNYAIKKDPYQAFLIKDIVVGWGISNNIAMILLLLLPFTFYFIFESDGIKHIVFTVIYAFQSACLLVTRSRGAIAVLPFLLLALFIYGVKKANNKKLFIRSQLITAALAVVFIGVFVFFHREGYKLLLNVFKSQITSFNGRFDIYKDVFSKMKNHYLFGYGLFAPFTNHVDVSGNAYQWSHGTFFQTLYSLGCFGLICLCFHMFEKYFLLIRDRSLPAMIVFFSFIGSGLYGLIDVSYYFINYMILLILLLIVVPIKTPKNTINYFKKVDKDVEC